MKMKILCLAQIALLLFSLCTWAQDQDSHAHQFRILAYGGEIKDIFYQDKGQETQLDIVTNVKTTFYDYDPSKLVQFYHHAIGPDGKPINVIVAQADLSHTPNDALLLMYADPTQAGTYKVDVVADDPAHFPGGSFRFISLIKIPVNVVMGQQVTRVDPGATVTAPGVPRADGFAVQLELLRADNQAPIYSSSMPYSPKARTMIFLVENSKVYGGIDLLDVSDSINNFPPPTP